MACRSFSATRRSATRYAYGQAATAILADARVDCVISEISVVSASLECQRQPDVGAPLLLAVPHIGALEALVTGHSRDGFRVTFNIAEAVRAEVAGEFAALSRPRLVN